MENALGGTHPFFLPLTSPAEHWHMLKSMKCRHILKNRHFFAAICNLLFLFPNGDIFCFVSLQFEFCFFFSLNGVSDFFAAICNLFFSPNGDK